MNFEIESGVEKTISGRGRKPTDFPLGSMEVKQSFLIKCDPSDSKIVESWRRKLRVAAKRFVETHGEGYKFETSVVTNKEDTDKSGLRVWRTQ